MWRSGCAVWWSVAEVTVSMTPLRATEEERGVTGTVTGTVTGQSQVRVLPESLLLKRDTVSHTHRCANASASLQKDANPRDHDKLDFRVARPPRRA